jgi:AraC family transcriptional regulator of adaptative response / DNA-3-methyladenine glycosylase II
MPAARRDVTSRILRCRGPFASESLLGFLGERAIPGVEEVRGSAYLRTLATPAGPAVLGLTATDGGIELDVAGGEAGAVQHAAEAARRVFDLDADPAAVGGVLERDPILRPLVRARPGVRVPGAAEGLEMVVRAVIGQQVSVSTARTMLGRVAAAFGATLGGAGSPATLFPTAERLAEAPLERLGIVGRRATAVRRVASSVARGELDLSGRGDSGETAHALLEIDGIGPWTVEYVRMRALRDPDAFPASDLGIRRAFERFGLDGSPRAVAERAERWRPWRAYAAMLLWQGPA